MIVQAEGNEREEESAVRSRRRLERVAELCAERAQRNRRSGDRRPCRVEEEPVDDAEAPVEDEIDRSACGVSLHEAEVGATLAVERIRRDEADRPAVDEREPERPRGRIRPHRTREAGTVGEDAARLRVATGFGIPRQRAREMPRLHLDRAEDGALHQLPVPVADPRHDAPRHVHETTQPDAHRGRRPGPRQVRHRRARVAHGRTVSRLRRRRLDPPRTGRHALQLEGAVASAPRSRHEPQRGAHVPDLDESICSRAGRPGRRPCRERFPGSHRRRAGRPRPSRLRGRSPRWKRSARRTGEAPGRSSSRRARRR